MHVVVSEEQGWLFVGIYDGFNGPDAPEFLMGNLYCAVYNELQGLFWEVEEEAREAQMVAEENALVVEEANPLEVKDDSREAPTGGDTASAKKVTFQWEGTEVTEGTENRRRRLWEFLGEAEAEDGLNLSGSERFAFSVDDALSVSKGGSAVSRRWLLLSKLKQGLSKHRDGHGRKFFPWRFGLEDKEKVEVDNRVVEEEETSARTNGPQAEGGSG